jgi:hypothetical protein
MYNKHFLIVPEQSGRKMSKAMLHYSLHDPQLLDTFHELCLLQSYYPQPRGPYLRRHRELVERLKEAIETERPSKGEVTFVVPPNRSVVYERRDGLLRVNT